MILITKIDILGILYSFFYKNMNFKTKEQFLLKFFNINLIPNSDTFTTSLWEH